MVAQVNIPSNKLRPTELIDTVHPTEDLRQNHISNQGIFIQYFKNGQRPTELIDIGRPTEDLRQNQIINGNKNDKNNTCKSLIKSHE